MEYLNLSTQHLSYIRGFGHQFNRLSRYHLIVHLIIFRAVIDRLMGRAVINYADPDTDD